ncbi:TonB-dependent receptor [Pseudoduganella sp. FT25W]|jgi:iron complex outermembrane receptor protein|uniref:TonB-dependent receptor n=1 Tax=Duganella alba TaxID=2666081 RepID=A0A6L5QE22_9BURK|nr:TonB-dependent receptor [Duganella alba]MRX07996.1 TonB-dependent receptor [Duganella alba]MRX16467.1 TonB-dependent receptor [Duganella alba]
MQLKKSVLAVALTLAYTHGVQAQTVSSQDKEVESVYVTGSNLKRVGKEGNSPVSVITALDIKASGASTVAELMRTVPSMGTDNNYDTNDGGFSRGVSTASLRGLSSTSTLILLNGRRMTPSAYADPNDGNSTLYDLNSIPLSALDRVEILKDGASAVYGSDAIGGVINFITKSNFEGLKLSARVGANDNNNFGRRGANAFWGKGDVEADGYNVFIAADISKRDRVQRSDATDIEFDQYKLLNSRYATPYGSTVSASPSIYRETAPGSKNFAVSQANAATRLVTRVNCDPSQQLVGTTAMGLPRTSVFINRTFCNYDTTKFLEAQSEGEDGSVLSRGVLKLNSTTRAFAEVAYSRTERNYTGAPITIGQSSVTNFTATGVGTPFQAILPIGHPDNPFPDARASVGYRFENLRGGTQTINTGIRTLVGLEGTWNSWDWNTGLLWNQSKKKDTTYGRLYLPTLNKLNTGTSLAQLAADPTLGHDVVTDNKASILQWDAKANTEFGHLPGGPVAFAAGVEVRQEKIKLNPDELVARGDIYGLANTAIDGSRDVKSAFVELRTPLLKSLELEFAGRVDKYENLKRNFVPKIGGKWAPSDMFALRGTYAKGFRAPGLTQVTPGGAQFFLSGLYDPKRCETDESTPKPGATEVDCNKSAAGTGGANPNLVPERSKSHSIGLIISPTSNIDLVVDFWRIRKEGEVILGSAFDALKNEDSNPGLVVRDTNPVNFVTDASGKPIPGTGPLLMVREPWINQGSSEVRGVDLEARFRQSLGAWGSVDTKVSSTYTSHYSIAGTAGDPEHNLAGSNAGITDWALSSGLDIPRWKTTLTANWSRGDHSVSANVNYIGPVSLLRRYDGTDTFAQPFCHYGTAKPTDAEPDRNTTIPLYEAYYPKCAVNSWTTVGMGYTYTGFKNLSLSLNIQNLFDKKAPYDPRYGATSGAPLAGYNEGLHNNYGRYFTFNATYTFY